jgi:hypothetical protein
MTQAEELFHRIAKDLPDAKEGKMFGALCIKAPNGKAAAMFWKDQMVFKLKGEAEQEAMSLDGADVFKPMGDRPMTGWVRMPFAHADRWPDFAGRAMDYVKTLEK